MPSPGDVGVSSSLSSLAGGNEELSGAAGGNAADTLPNSVLSPISFSSDCAKRFVCLCGNDWYDLLCFPEVVLL